MAVRMRCMQAMSAPARAEDALSPRLLLARRLTCRLTGVQLRMCWLMWAWQSSRVLAMKARSRQSGWAEELSWNVVRGHVAYGQLRRQARPPP